MATGQLFWYLLGCQSLLLAEKSVREVCSPKVGYAAVKVLSPMMEAVKLFAAQLKRNFILLNRRDGAMSA